MVPSAKDWPRCVSTCACPDWRNSRDSGSAISSESQHPAQALTPVDHASVSKVARFWADKSVGQALMIALGMIQLNNKTPILGRLERSIMRGIVGMAGECGYMRGS